MRDIQTGRAPEWPYKIGVQNLASEAAPAYAALQIISAPAPDENAVYQVTKPTGTAEAKYILNAPEQIAAGGFGAATDLHPAAALVSGTPSINQEIGPTNGSWSLSVNGKGFIFLGGLAGGVGRVASKGGTTAGDDFPLVKILNSSGLAKPYGAIYGYGPPVDPPPGTLFRIPTFISGLPTAGKPFCVGLDAVEHGGVIDAGPVGVVACKINYTDQTHEYADAISNEYGHLTSAAIGQARIIWRENGSIQGSGTLGIQWARVLLVPPQVNDDLRGISYSQITAATGTQTGPITPGIGLAKLFTTPTGAAGTAWQIQATAVTAENWMFSTIQANKPILLRKSRQDGSGNWIYLVVAEGCAAVPGSG